MIRLSDPWCDAWCDQWQQAWDSGAPIPIESLVQTNEVTYPEETVARLLRLELEARRARGDKYLIHDTENPTLAPSPH